VCVAAPSLAGKEVEETLHVVDAQTREAAAKKQVVEGEEAIASEKAAAAKAIKVCGPLWLCVAAGQALCAWLRRGVCTSSHHACHPSPCPVYTGRVRG
jgi:hypothetical protein